MNLSEFDFSVPAELIAKHPLKNRDGCRLLALEKTTGQMAHRQFSDVLEYLQPGDVLVLNDAKVNKSRFFATRLTGGKVEVLLCRPISPPQGECHSPLRKNNSPGSVGVTGGRPLKEFWEAIISHSSRVKEGEFLTLNGNGSCSPPRVGEGLWERSGFRILFKQEGRAIVEIVGANGVRPISDIFEKYGTVPIPPYLERPAEKEDEEDYQTVFAKTPGASAAPTAGLHFTPELLDKIKTKGVEIVYLSLLVGPGTFEPIRTEDISQHKMHKEYFEIGEETCAKINAAKKSGKKIWAVGTTVVKALETACRGLINQTPTVGANGVRPFSGDSDLFIHPPFDFKIVDGLITNFHWPRSSLILLVAAFAGKDQILSAYNEAIAQRYRFFSYGDAMLIY
ncbi:MAG: tRNA preQ1(34) S-adenosylmethionine ribosyltransferase-isomerase QueA [candidate division Zixibacteria bacterium]|nr:tRNA preQ1(34) S-adenosylmethionine ribosyltransferase-isomerase QueA [candidate division Zixibacteria bacterium]